MTTMTTATAQDVLETLQDIITDYGYDTPEGSDGHCGIATYATQLAIPRAWAVTASDTRIGIYGHPAVEHTAAIIDGLVYDLTARQFEPTMPCPWVTTLPVWKARVRRWLGVDHMTTTVRDEHDWDIPQSRVTAGHGRAKAGVR